MYQVFNHFLLRTPLFPFNIFEKIPCENEEFTEIFINKYFQEAIFTASPALYRELLKYLEGKLIDKKEQEQLLGSLERYFSRMSTRCTPFGLFAACSCGEIGNKTNIRVKDTIQKETRLDMYYLSGLSQSLSQIPEIRSKIKYYPNSSLYSTGIKYRYIEYKYIGERRVNRISAIQRSFYLDALLKKSYKGATIDELQHAIQENDISKEDALDFIDEVIDSQILVGELSPSVTGEDMLAKMTRILDSIDFQDSTVLLIKKIQLLLRKLNEEKENPFDVYQNIIEKAELLKIPYKENLLFQTDATRKAEHATLGRDVIEELQSAMQFLNRITQYGENPALTKFRQLFYERYEDREVLLAEVLDPEMGIGYPAEPNKGDFSPLLEHFFIPPNREQNTFISPISNFQSILLKKTIDVLSTNMKEITLDDQDIKNFPKADWNNLPPTMYCMFELLKNDSGGTLLKIISFGGSCGANLLARFSHTDEKICRFVKDITHKEQDLMSDVILAEIAHLPESRVGNILSRPHLRKYELMYLSNSDLPQEQLIYISDLMLSIRRGKLFLRSKKLNKEIIPRLTTAHNYRNNPTPIYRFLCDMQTHHVRSGLFFSWGSLENTFPFLPRVRYKNTILSPASWTVNITDIKHLLNIKEKDTLIPEIEKWRMGIFLPRYVLLQDGDNELFIDWESFISIRSLFSIIKKRSVVKFTEFPFETDDIVVRGKNGRYLNECIAAFYKEK